ncbi:hypothetical protein ACFSTC_52610 [Nonomuraea ferruginea]
MGGALSGRGLLVRAGRMAGRGLPVRMGRMAGGGVLLGGLLIRVRLRSTVRICGARPEPSGYVGPPAPGCPGSP